MFFGRYELLRQIGRGGMAEVHVARLGDGAAGKLLALKRLRPSRSSREKVVKRLVSEAQLTVWLHHPNIVQLFDFGRIDGQYYIAMELVDGCDLKQVIHPPGAMPRQLPMEVALDVAAQLADALRYAHRCTDSHGRPLGIIHRDVSPHNVLVSRDGHPKLTDFGVARVMQSSEESMPGLVIGKLAYMPPEQARGEGIDHRVDIYALGATLYEMLTGAKPFDSSSRAEAREARRPAPPSTLRPSVPASLDALVLQAMAPRADERPSDAGELAEALRHELAAHGGAPKRHQLAELVREALDERVRAAFPHTRQLTLRDYTPEEDSLIPRQVTAVRDMALGSVPDAAVTRQRELPRELPREPPAPTREATRAERPAEQRDDDARTGGRALAGWPLLLVLAGVLALGFALGRVSKSRSPVTSHGAGGSGGRVLASSGGGDDAARTVARADGGGADIYIDAAPKKDAGAKPSAPLAAAVDAAGGGGGGGGEPAVRVERPSGRPGAAAAPAAPRRRRRTARRHRERVVAKRPPVARGVLSPVKLARMLRSCRTAYVNAKYLVALRRARAILHWQPSNQEAWQVIGASACMLRQGALVRLSLKHLGGSARNLIRSVCQRAGLTP